MFCIWCRFYYFYFNIIVSYVMLKLRPPRTQIFLKSRNIWSCSWDIQKWNFFETFVKKDFLKKLAIFIVKNNAYNMLLSTINNFFGFYFLGDANRPLGAGGFKTMWKVIVSMYDVTGSFKRVTMHARHPTNHPESRSEWAVSTYRQIAWRM